MALVCILGAWLSGSDFDRLGDADWRTREAAELRLRMWGVLAVPGLLDAARSDNPEVRGRASRLLMPWHRVAREMRTAAVILSPFPPDPVALWHDPQARRDLFRVAEAGGWQWHAGAAECWPILAGAEWVTVEDVASAVQSVRDHCGVQSAGWPFR